MGDILFSRIKNRLFLIITKTYHFFNKIIISDNRLDDVVCQSFRG